MKKCIFGVFNNGKLVFQIGLAVNCTDYQASIIVSILDLAKDCLKNGNYFAYDYTH